MSKFNREIELLNYGDLDVDELERRLETAATTGISLDCWMVDSCAVGCCNDGCSDGCSADCGTLCGANDPCELYGCGGGHLIP